VNEDGYSPPAGGGGAWVHPLVLEGEGLCSRLEKILLRPVEMDTAGGGVEALKIVLRPGDLPKDKNQHVR